MNARFGKSVWAFVGFLAMFCILLLLVTKVYLLPALAAFNAGDERERKLLGVHALLLMLAILVILGLSGILIFGIGRYFLPRKRQIEPKTTYTDAWTEAGKRLRGPEDQ
jgi:hypothetical protein